MLKSPWLFTLVIVPAFYLIAFFFFSIFGEVPFFIKTYLAFGCLIGLGLFFIKKAKRERSVWPINGSEGQNYDLFYQEFRNEGFIVEEYEPLEGRQLNVFLNHPGVFYFAFRGSILLLAGIFPGILWFILGRDRLSVTFKEDAGFVQYIFESNNGKYAGNVWQRIHFRYIKEHSFPK